MIKSKKIKMKISGSEIGSPMEFSDIPKPAKKYFPEWYKQTPFPEVTSTKDLHKKNIKYCMPFTDSFLTGYIIETPCDIHIKKHEFVPEMSFNQEIKPFAIRDSSSAGLMPVPKDCYDIHIIFRHGMHIKTPKGYSLLITNPLNRHDLPFVALSGIVDTDIDPLRPGNYPVFLKKDFEGLIPKGTPILQIIPIKRDSWESEQDDSLLTTWPKYISQIISVFHGWYKKNVWQKKVYN